MKKSIIKLIDVLLVIIISFTACNNEEYIVEYPEKYTAEYCLSNYVKADPNLIHLRSADNSLGTINKYGLYFEYYAIKDIPLDEYLCVQSYGLLSGGSDAEIFRYEDLEISEPEILSYKLKSAKLYWNFDNNVSENFPTLGAVNVYQDVVSIDAEYLQSYIRKAIDEENYVVDNSKFTPVLKRITVNNGRLSTDIGLTIMVHFEKYENIVWCCSIDKFNGEYYLCFYNYPNFEELKELDDFDAHTVGYESLSIPLYDELSNFIRNNCDQIQ
ncbi:MAG: hypothetical protein E7641_05515 [Ruminococcaceae bacterium]|nr:hypothetical protein [Oscillospiraceae bacterium]